MNDLKWRILSAINFVAFLAAFLFALRMGGCTGEVELASGATAPMKCHWTFVAVTLVSLIGITLVVCSTYINERMARMCCMVGLFVTIFVICVLMTSFGIGVCSSAMHCYNTRLAVLICMGVSLVVSIISFIKANKFNELEVPKQTV